MNKKLSLLLIFLLSFTIQSMKRSNTELITSQPTKIQKLQKKRGQFKKKLVKLDKDNIFWWLHSADNIFWWLHSADNKKFLSCTYRQNLHKKTIDLITILYGFTEEEKFFGSYNIDNLNKLSQRKLQLMHKIRIKKYSALGSATMAEEVLYEEKKEFIQKLLNLGFTPTPKDRKLSLLATYEEFGTSIIQKKLLLQQYTSCLLEIDIPQEIKDYIALLIFKTELLF